MTLTAVACGAMAVSVTLMKDTVDDLAVSSAALDQATEDMCHEVLGECMNVTEELYKQLEGWRKLWREHLEKEHGVIHPKKKFDI
jgi:hypothetical protein